jgi:hypothetical protein
VHKVDKSDRDDLNGLKTQNAKHGPDQQGNIHSSLITFRPLGMIQGPQHLQLGLQRRASRDRLLCEVVSASLTWHAVQPAS